MEETAWKIEPDGIRTGPAVRTPSRTLGLAIAAAALLAFIPACSSSSTPTADSTTSSPPSADATSTTSSVTVPEQNPAELAACAADAQTVETALAAYMAGKDAYPSPPAPWSAATYAANFGPLTGGARAVVPSCTCPRNEVLRH